MLRCYHCSFPSAHVARVSGGKCVMWAPCSATDSLVMSKYSGFLAGVFSQDKEGKKWQVQTHASAVFAKSHKIPTRDMLVIKTNKKRTDECINQSSAKLRCWAVVHGAPPQDCAWRGVGLTQLHAGAPVSEICLSSSFLVRAKMLWLDIKLKQSIPLQNAGWPASMPSIVELLIKCMHA